MPALPADHEAFARAALPAYARPDDTALRLLSLSENATYLVGGGSPEPLVLRVHRPGYHDLAAIRSELAWMSALRTETSVATPRVVPAADGRDVVTVAIGDTALHVDAVSFVPGCTAEEAPGAVGAEDLGRLTAVMHDHAQRWVRPAGFTRFRWDVATMIGPDARWGDWRLAPGFDAAGRAVTERAAARTAAVLDAFGTAPQRFGLVHADLRTANLMVDPSTPGSSITVIDFDDCGWSWHLADLGAVVSFIEDTVDAEPMVAGWLRGYREARPLTDADLAMVPTFVMARRLMLTAWVASHADADHSLAFVDGFAAGTADVAERYLRDRSWMTDAAHG